MKNSIFNKIMLIFQSTTGFLVVFLVWLILARKTSSFILPGPGEVLQALNRLFYSGELAGNLIVTIKRTITGYGLALLAGFIIALLMNINRTVKRVFRPLITVIQTTPPVVWIVLAVIWFGVAEDFTPVFMIFVVTFPVVFINVFVGLQDINQELIEMARVYSWGKRQIIRHIYLPSLVPHLVSGVSIGFSFAWKSTVFAEFIGSSSGIGYALSVANNNLETSVLFAWALVLIILMLIVEYLLIKPLQSKATGWKNYE